MSLLFYELCKLMCVCVWWQIDAYSLSQPTLEQVFLNVIGDQLTDDGAVE